VAVYKRGNTWYYYFRLNGVRYRKAVPEARTKFQAQQAEAKARDAIFAGKYGRVESTTTFKEFVEAAYLPWARENKRSWRNDVSRAKPLVAFFGKRRLSEVTRFLIEQYKRERRTSLNGRGRLCSPSSVNRELELLSRILNLAVERDELESNPFRGVKKLASDNHLTRYLSTEEEERLLSVLTGRRAHLRPIVLIGLHTGMRRGEILSLRWGQIDFVRESIHLLRTKSGRPRQVPMNSVVKAVLLDMREVSGGSEFVFPNHRTGNAIADIKNAFNAALKEAEIEGFRFHDLRHTAGTRMADAGVPITAVADILGHADVRTTMRYAHATDEARRRAVRALEEKSGSLSPKAATERKAAG
jgi:integrase